MGELRLKEGKQEAENSPANRSGSDSGPFKSPCRVVDLGRICAGEGEEKKSDFFYNQRNGSAGFEVRVGSFTEG
jgi:hypothetical protein